MTYPEKITHNELIELGRDWLIRSYVASAPHGHYGCGLVLTELTSATRHGEQPDVLGFCNGKSILIECKASRADFNADKNKPFRLFEQSIGLQRWYMAPLGIIPAEKVPEKWGLLEVTPGREILVTKKAEAQPRDFYSEITMIISTMRRLNIAPDGHVAIKRYESLKGVAPSKNRATFYVAKDDLFCNGCPHIAGAGDLWYCDKYTGFDADLYAGPEDNFYRCKKCIENTEEEDK